VGLLVAILVASIGNLRDRARTAKCVGNLKQISVLMNVYRTAHLRYPEALLDDFRPLAELTNDYSIFVCPGSDDTVRSVADLHGKTSYRYFGSLSLLTRLATGSAGGTSGTVGSVISTDRDRGHGNDSDHVDEDNPAWQRKHPQTLVFDPSAPIKSWKHQCGAVYDQVYSQHDGVLNMVHLENGRWESIPYAVAGARTR
jgi:type II secretory pathway pseudopilin PulG